MTHKNGKRANKQKPTKITMRDWKNMEDLKCGKKAFIKALQQDPEELKCCVENPNYAKTSFAHHGKFYIAGQKLRKGVPKPKGETPIPKSTEFRVFEKLPIEKRDELVTIVLPGAGSNEFIAQDWRCTYTPWASKQKPKRSSPKGASGSAKRR
jgi:hypothetical protein